MKCFYFGKAAKLAAVNVGTQKIVGGIRAA